ncbi:MAG: plasmid recombination protein [Desulfomicrobium sp.]
MKKISCGMKALKFDQYKRRKAHDMREQKKTPRNIDPARICRNTVVIPTPSAKEALELVNKIKAESGARQKFNPARNNLVHDGILSFSHEAQSVVHALDVQEQVRRIVESIREVCELHKGRLIGLTIHRDEYAIHAHFQILAVGEDGRMLRIGPRDCRQRQDVAARAWNDLGITRGKSKRDRIADGESWRETTKMSVAQMHEELPRQLAELEAQRAELVQEKEWLFQEVLRLQMERAKILERLGIAKEVFAAEEGILIDQKNFQKEPRMTLARPR